MTAQGVICIFAKPPVPGRVKTRLVPVIGEEGAAALARAFIVDSYERVRSITWARLVVATTDPAGMEGILPDDQELWPQGEGDLGDRMERVLRRALDDGAGYAMIVGTDLPGLPMYNLEQARDALLSGTDAVLGPALDGGFYLIGLSCPPPRGLLADLPWSRTDTLAHTKSRLEDAGLSLAWLDSWFDIDEPKDLERLALLLRCGGIAPAPETARVLVELGLWD